MLPVGIMARACVIDFLGAKIFEPAIAIRSLEMRISSHVPTPASTIRLNDLINFGTDYCAKYDVPEADTSTNAFVKPLVQETRINGAESYPRINGASVIIDSAVYSGAEIAHDVFESDTSTNASAQDTLTNEADS